MSLSAAEQGQILAILSMAEAIQHQARALLDAYRPKEAEPAPIGAADPELDPDAPPLTFMQGRGMVPVQVPLAECRDLPA